MKGTGDRSQESGVRSQEGDGELLVDIKRCFGRDSRGDVVHWEDIMDYRYCRAGDPEPRNYVRQAKGKRGGCFLEWPDYIDVIRGAILQYGRACVQMVFAVPGQVEHEAALYRFCCRGPRALLPERLEVA
jgi:hypothetical protein